MHVCNGENNGKHYNETLSGMGKPISYDNYNNRYGHSLEI